jgi:predicted O-methyltransferase YrrM
MSREVWAKVDKYIFDELVGPDEALDQTVRTSADAGLPYYISVSPTQGKLLFLLARALRARMILEIGTLGGYSAIWLGRALSPLGRLISLEVDPKHAEVARANVDRAGLTKKVEIRLGRALDTLPKLVSEGHGPFDMFFIDADKANIPDYIEWSLRLSRPGSMIVVDNVIRRGKIVNKSSTDENVIGVRRMYEMFSKDPRLTATAIQTVGGKGYDGFAIALVNEPVKIREPKSRRRRARP